MRRPTVALRIVRNLLIFFLVLAGIWWVRRALTRIKGPGDGRRGKDAGPPAAPERMRECSHCGVNVPESEGLCEGERFYCCEAHRRAGPRAG